MPTGAHDQIWSFQLPFALSRDSPDQHAVPRRLAPDSTSTLAEERAKHLPTTAVLETITTSITETNASASAYQVGGLIDS